MTNNTIATTGTGRMNIIQTVYETAKGIGGNFTTYDILTHINAQVSDEETVTNKQVLDSLNWLSRMTDVYKRSANWYTSGKQA